MGSLLPRVGPAGYRALAGEAGWWLPAMRAICARHGLDRAGLERLREGTNVVFAVGGRIVKLYPRHWSRNAEAERAVAVRVHGALGPPTPAVEAHGTLEGWPYLVMERLDGPTLDAVWPMLDPASRQRIVSEIGALLARLHAIPADSLTGLDRDWPGYVERRIAGCVARHAEHGASPDYLEQMPAFLASAAPLYPPSYRLVIVSADVHQWHLLVEERGDGWHLCGLFDFDDARLGHCEYDLAAPGLFLMAGRPGLLRAFLSAYGYGTASLDADLSARLLAYTLLHPYRAMTWWLPTFVPGASAALSGLARDVYGFD